MTLKYDLNMKKSANNFFLKYANLQDNESITVERQMQLDVELSRAKLEIAEKYGYFEDSEDFE